MNYWLPPLAVFVAGALGGLVKILMSGAGDIVLPGKGTGAGGVKIWRPGWLVGPIVGATAALVSWALYGPSAGKMIFATSPEDLTWANVAAAILVGIAGAGWLSAEVDKTIFKKTAVEAASKDKNFNLAATISSTTPDEALKAALDSP